MLIPQISDEAVERAVALDPDDSGESITAVVEKKFARLAEENAGLARIVNAALSAHGTVLRQNRSDATSAAAAGIFAVLAVVEAQMQMEKEEKDVRESVG
jgi:hypothetical protein